MRRILARTHGFKMVFQYLFNKQIDLSNLLDESCLPDEVALNQQSKEILPQNDANDDAVRDMDNLSKVERIVEPSLNKSNGEDEILSDEEKEFSLKIFTSVKENLDELNAKISTNLKNGLKIDDLYKVDYSILLVAMACIDYLQESVALATNEAVKLAKKYSTDKSSSFVNGVLSSIYKNQA